MRQPIKNRKTTTSVKKEVSTTKKRRVIKKKPIKKPEIPKYGMSKLEHFFANEFLDKYNISYIYEFEGGGRYYDFAIVSKAGNYIVEDKHGLKSIKQKGQHVPIDLLIEVDGSFWHADPRFTKDNELTIVQKRNKRVDEIKNRWASEHGIPLIRFWEFDIKKDKKKVLEELKKYVNIDVSNKK